MHHINRPIGHRGNDFNTKTLLYYFYESVKENQKINKSNTSNEKESKGQNSNCFNSILKQFASYIYMIGGRLLYETLYSNMKNILPSITTIYRFIDHSYERAEEGSFCFKELLVFLIKRNLSSYVWISEDATRITKITKSRK